MKMKKYTLIALLFSVVVFVPFGLRAADNPSIIVFDIERAIGLSKVGKNMAEQLIRLNAEIQDDANDVNKSLRDEAKRLEEQRSLLAPDVWRVKYEDLRSEESDRQEELSGRIRALQAGRQKAMQEILVVLESELSKIAKDRKVDIVLHKASAEFVNPDFDVTGELVKRLDKRIKTVRVRPITQRQ